jgi:hypothetical protein
LIAKAQPMTSQSSRGNQPVTRHNIAFTMIVDP